LLRKISGRQFHRAGDRDLSSAFILVHPGVCGQRFLCFFANGFQSFHPLFGARFFVIATARHRTNHGEHDHAE
jgi:hypothetical protein